MKRRSWIESARIRIFRDPEPGILLPGEASEHYKLTWLEHGALHSVAEGRDTLLCAGELLIHPPGQWHIQYADTDHAPRFVSITLATQGMDLSALTGRKLSPTPEICASLSQAIQESEIGDAYSDNMILALLETALLRLLRAHSAFSPDLAISAIHTENRIIRRAQQYISGHVRDKLTVPTVAKNAEVSPSYLTALFQKHLRISPGEYIRRVKLQASKEMIREGKQNLTEIAAALNYSTIYHFSRQFKEKFGISPSEYAKTLR